MATSQLTIETIEGIAGVVEAMQREQAEAFGQPVATIHAGIRTTSFGVLRGVTRLVGHIIDRTLAPIAPIAGTVATPRWLDTTLAVLNGVIGDHLESMSSPLAFGMELRYRGRPLSFEPDALAHAMPDATGKLLVLVHGSCGNDDQWRQAGHDHGEALATDLAYTPLYVRYNSGRHISTNGAELAELLEQLVSAWPTALEEIVILAHSMGGLVARAACQVGEARNHRWRAQLTKLICLGTPHLGAPYERLGNWVDRALASHPYTAPLAKLGKIRSAGITDLRFGSISDDDWKDRDRFVRGTPPHRITLPAGVECYALAASLSSASASNPRDDGLVPVRSALGRGKRTEHTLAFAPDHQAIVFETGHISMLSSPTVYTTVRDWLARQPADHVAERPRPH